MFFFMYEHFSEYRLQLQPCLIPKYILTGICSQHYMKMKKSTYRSEQVSQNIYKQMHIQTHSKVNMVDQQSNVSPM